VSEQSTTAQSEAQRFVIPKVDLDTFLMKTKNIKKTDEQKRAANIAPVGIKTPPNAVQLLLPLQFHRKRRGKVIANNDSCTRRRAEKIAPSCPV
jgi:hypothetical protein